MHFSRFEVSSETDYIVQRNIFIRRKRLSASTELIGAYKRFQVTTLNLKF